MTDRQSVFRVLPTGRAESSAASPRLRSRRQKPDAAGDWMTPAMRDAVDQWAAAQPDPKPSRTEALRRLLEKGLAD